MSDLTPHLEDNWLIGETGDSSNQRQCNQPQHRGAAPPLRETLYPASPILSFGFSRHRSKSIVVAHSFWNFLQILHNHLCGESFDPSSSCPSGLSGKMFPME
jgi:hypothetical protein